jgi:serine/threonine protein kinase
MIDSSRPDQPIGKYRLLRLLGQGVSSEIYLAQQEQSAEQVAIKLLYGRRSGDELAKFFAQASQISHLRHPHIASLLDFGVEGESSYIVMEYAPHGTLRERHPRGSIVPPATVLLYAQQAAEALQYVHEHKFIHRDIKPQNMLLGANEEIKISDFGVAVVSHSLDPLYPEQHDFEGTVIYAAPEQLQGKPRRSSDQYALGVVIYELLCGDWPFSGSFHEIAHQHLFASPPPLREKNAALPPALEQVVMKALTKDPENRFESMKAFAEALTWAIDQSPAVSPDSSSSARAKRQFMSPLPFADR